MRRIVVVAVAAAAALSGCHRGAATQDAARKVAAMKTVEQVVVASGHQLFVGAEVQGMVAAYDEGVRALARAAP